MTFVAIYNFFKLTYTLQRNISRSMKKICEKNSDHVTTIILGIIIM